MEDLDNKVALVKEDSQVQNSKIDKLSIKDIKELESKEIVDAIMKDILKI